MFSPFRCSVWLLLQPPSVAARLWVSAFSFVFSSWKACSVGLGSADWLGHWRISNFCLLRNSWVSWVQLALGHYPVALWSTVWSVWLHLAECEQRVQPRAHFASSTSSHINQRFRSVSLAAIHAHTVTPCLTDNMLPIMSCFSPSHLCRPIPQVYLAFICRNYIFPELKAFSDVFWQILIWPSWV